jgi:peroxiredoxin (alkyl hydroperoxide reductase subunit C)
MIQLLCLQKLLIKGDCTMAEMKDGCVKPVRGPIMPAPESTSAPEGVVPSKEASRMLARVGKEAPDFEASAFIAGKGFKPIKLSDYKGKWIVLCFYPGDFTFV